MSVLGFITPYRRVCGSIFLVVAVALAPSVRFGVSLAISPRAGQLSVWALFALYVLIVMMPSLRRVTERASFVVLAGALALVTVAMLCAAQVQQLVARSIGFYSDSLPWLQAQTLQPAWTYRNSFAGYTLQIPNTWLQASGPIEGTSELTLQETGRLRPSCDVLDRPLAITVQDMLRGAPDMKRSCGYWRGLEVCLLEQPASATSAHWDWLGRDPESSVQVRLMFELAGVRARADALAIISSLRLAAPSFKASTCPNPLEWAEP